MASYYRDAVEEIELPMPVYVVARMVKGPGLRVYYAGPLVGWISYVDEAWGFGSWGDAERCREAVGGAAVLRVYGADFANLEYRH